MSQEKAKRFSPEVRDRAVLLVIEHGREHYFGKNPPRMRQ